MRVVLLVMVAGLAAGCASSPPAPTAAQPGVNRSDDLSAPTAAQLGVNLSGYPPAFRVGYADGCSSVNAARRRDEARFKSDTQYAQGWRDGYDICARR